MKLISCEIVAEAGEFIYGVDTFDDQMVIPWMRLKPDALIGQAWTWVDGEWKITKKQ